MAGRVGLRNVTTSSATFQAESFDNIVALARQPSSGLKILDRRWLLRVWRRCFVGREFVDWLIERNFARNRVQAESLAASMEQQGLLKHVTRAHPFKDAYLFYRFLEDENQIGFKKRWFKESKHLEQRNAETLAHFEARREALLSILAIKETDLRRELLGRTGQSFGLNKLQSSVSSASIDSFRSGLSREPNGSQISSSSGGGGGGSSDSSTSTKTSSTQAPPPQKRSASDTDSDSDDGGFASHKASDSDFASSAYDFTEDEDEDLTSEDPIDDHEELSLTEDDDDDERTAPTTKLPASTTPAQPPPTLEVTPAATLLPRAATLELPAPMSSPRAASLEVIPAATLSPRAATLEVTPAAMLSPRAATLELPAPMSSPRAASLEVTPAAMLSPRAATIEVTPAATLSPRAASLEVTPAVAQDSTFVAPPPSTQAPPVPSSPRVSIGFTRPHTSSSTSRSPPPSPAAASSQPAQRSPTDVPGAPASLPCTRPVNSAWRVSTVSPAALSSSGEHDASLPVPSARAVARFHSTPETSAQPPVQLNRKQSSTVHTSKPNSTTDPSAASSPSSTDGSTKPPEAPATAPVLNSVGVPRPGMLTSISSKVLDDSMGTEYFDELLGLHRSSDLYVKSWNERFQEIMAAIHQGTTKQGESPSKHYADLITLSKDFLFSAMAYGKIIISEFYLDNKHKTIKPAKVGGVAGGLKYICQGILFKFAVDAQGIYGHDDAAAATVAGHELKGFQAYFNLGLPDLRLPLMALVDYRGFRLIAMSLLPLDNTTLVYGSSDGGNTVHNENDAMNDIMQQAAAKLRLKPHLAGFDPNHRKLVYSAVDVEGHLGLDGKYYLIDFARTFPCEKPSARGENLTNLFRPEFCATYSKPLCSDAYSGFTDSSHNSEIDQATLFLRESKLVKYMTDITKEVRRRLETAASPDSIFAMRLTESIHRAGINVRHLGRLYSLIIADPPSEFRHTCCAIVMVEMISRVLKRDLKRRMRELMSRIKMPLEQPYLLLIVDTLNLIFGTSKLSTAFWNNVIKPATLAKFKGLNMRGNMDAFYCADNPDDFKQFVATLIESVGPSVDWRWIILRRWQAMEAFHFSATAEAELPVRGPNSRFDTATPLYNSDILRLGERIKYITIISFAEGLLYMLDSIRKTHTDEAGAVDLLLRAISKFEEVLNSNSNNIVTLRECANACLSLDKMMANHQQWNASGKQSANMQRAGEYLTRALNLEPDNPQTLCMQALFSQRSGKIADAENYFLTALELSPTYTDALLQYSLFLRFVGESKLAQRFRHFYLVFQKA